ncbi:MAG: carboxypeptidase-like regulatory domain-containing protein, partial [Bryobacterales bacterium]
MLAKFREPSLLVILTVLALLSAPIGYGQVTTATLFGRVADPTGAVIPGANVTATHNATSQTKAVITDERGEFTIPFLPVGAYTVTVRADGFKTYERSGLALSSGQKADIVFTLELGVTSETISVTGEVPLLNTVNAEQDINIDSRQVADLPVLNRDITNLIDLG